MANLDLTIGLNMEELEKGLANAGKSIGKLSGSVQAGKNPFQATANQLSTGMGIGTMLGGPIGGLIGAFVDAFGGMIGSLISKLKELGDYAMNIRRLSIQTGLSVEQIRSFEGVAKAFGSSVENIAKSFTEFTRRMGEARIKGGEVTNILAKMGVGMDEVANGTFNHEKAMKELADAYAAGTDEATLLYYGTKMFGDGFKELLPIIKAGSKAVEDSMNSYIDLNSAAGEAYARSQQDIDNINRSWDNMWINMVGSTQIFIEKIKYYVESLFDYRTYNPFETKEDAAKRMVDNAPTYMTNEEIVKFLLETLDEEDRDEMEQHIRNALKGNGKVLNPFGMAEAGAASQMQQMAGGDIFGAVAFSPLERIATATEATAEHTRPRDEPPPRTPDEVTR